jgi:hypothetical protein
MKGALPRRAVLNVYETSHPENRQRLWAWSFHAPEPQGFTMFHKQISPSLLPQPP